MLKSLAIAAFTFCSCSLVFAEPVNFQKAEIVNLRESAVTLDEFNSFWERYKQTSQYNLYVMSLDLTETRDYHGNSFAQWTFQGAFASKKACESIGSIVSDRFAPTNKLTRDGWGSGSDGAVKDKFIDRNSPVLPQDYLLHDNLPFKCVMNGLTAR